MNTTVMTMAHRPVGSVDLWIANFIVRLGCHSEKYADVSVNRHFNVAVAEVVYCSIVEPMSLMGHCGVMSGAGRVVASCQPNSYVVVAITTECYWQNDVKRPLQLFMLCCRKYKV